MAASTTLTVKMTDGAEMRRFAAPPHEVTYTSVHARVADAYDLAKNEFKLQYRDDENDIITMTTDDEMADAISLALRTVPSVLRLTIVKKRATTERANPPAPKAVKTPPAAEPFKQMPDDVSKFVKQMPDDVGKFVKQMAEQLPALASQLPACMKRMLPHAEDELGALFAQFANGATAKCGGDVNCAAGVHPGVTCDKSGMSPIVGFRYNLPGHNWDVCQAEFDKLPESEKSLYVKIAPPYAPPKRFSAAKDEHTADRYPSGAHPGVTCDKSGMSPIVGFRYNLPGHNWDVCQAEFDKLPDAEKALYVKIPPPSHGSKDCAPPHRFGGGGFRGCHGGFGGGGFGGGGPCGGFGRGFNRGGGGEGPKLAARFVRDVSIFDGTQMAPGDRFTKIWKIKNVGQVPWPPGTKMLFVGGDQMTSELSVPVSAAPVMPGEEVDVAVDMVAPQELGRYVSYFRLTGPLGRRRFGQRVWAHVHVVDPHKADEPPNENEMRRMAEAHAAAERKALADDDDDDDNDADENSGNAAPIAEDGLFGPYSTMALQTMLQSEGLSTGPVDGHFGPRTKAAAQTFLASRGFDLGPIDGWWGRRSTRALQAWLRHQGGAPGPLDGRWGTRTSRAFQAVLNELRKKPSSSVESRAEEPAAAAPSSEPVAAEPSSSTKKDAGSDPMPSKDAGSDPMPSKDAGSDPMPSKDSGSDPMPSDDKEGDSPFVKVKREDELLVAEEFGSEEFGYNEKYHAWMPIGADPDKWAADNLSVPPTRPLPPKMKPMVAPDVDTPATEKSDVERVADELAAMGFTDAELVHVVIEKNGADLEACASDLASLSEWDTLLDDLDEMGFADRALNKRLMVKNKGSLKMTVRDLVTDRD